MSTIKKMILGFLYLFIVLILINQVIYCQNFKDESLNLRVKDIRDNVVDLNPNDLTLIIFYNSINCHNCFIELNNYISKNRPRFKDIICIVRSGNNSKYAEKITLNAAKDLLKIDKYYIDLHNKDDLPTKLSKEGLFYKFNITKTPAILILKDNLTFLSYEDLFGKSTNLEKILNKYLNN